MWLILLVTHIGLIIFEFLTGWLKTHNLRAWRKWCHIVTMLSLRPSWESRVYFCTCLHHWCKCAVLMIWNESHRPNVRYSKDFSIPEVSEDQDLSKLEAGNSIECITGHSIAFSKMTRQPCGAVSLSGDIAQRDGAARLSCRDFLHFLTLWPWTLIFWRNINWWARYCDGLSPCQVWRFWLLLEVQ